MTFISESNEIADALRGKRKTALYTPPFELIRRREVEAATHMSRSKIYGMMDPASSYYDPAFPLPLRIGARSVAWRVDELTAWFEQLPRATRGDIAD